MNIAIIFAGGAGERMNSKTRPKQFLELHGKPIIIYTIEQFQMHSKIDKIIIICIEEWIDYCQKLVDEYSLNKVAAIIPGGANGQLSIYKGINKAYELYNESSILLIHDGVRPLIDKETISRNIECVKSKGSSITIVPATETIVLKENDNMVKTIIERSCCETARAPQCFFLRDIYRAHSQAILEGKLDFIDSASLMHYYKYPLFTVEGKTENIKITTPADFYTFRALLDARENSQIFGI